MLVLLGGLVVATIPPSAAVAEVETLQLVRGSALGRMACLVVVVVLIGLALLSIIALIFLGGQASEILEEVGRSI